MIPSAAGIGIRPDVAASIGRTVAGTELPARMFVWLASCHGRLQAVALQLCDSLPATLDAFGRFFETSACVPSRAAPWRYVGNGQLMIQLQSFQLYPVTDSNTSRGPRRFTIDAHMPALNRGTCRGPGLVEAREPEPPIHSQGAIRHSYSLTGA